jgi:hypothetical protein
MVTDIMVIKTILRGVLPLFFIVFIFTEALSFNFNLNMKNGEGCVYSGGKVICRESKKDKKANRDCIVNLWGEVVCFQKEINSPASSEETSKEKDEEPFFKIK